MFDTLKKLFKKNGSTRKKLSTHDYYKDSKPKKLSVRDFYNECAETEFTRTTQDACHILEFQTTEHIYKKYLKPGMKILDAGGGPGRYTIDLAKKGYHMTLLDISDKELDIAKRKIKQHRVDKFVDSVDLGSITELPYKDNSFDMVLCLGGPLSHVYTEQARKKAIKELVRVAKPGAPVFISVMNRAAVLNLCVRDFERYSQSDTDKNKKNFWAEQFEFANTGEDQRFCGRSYAHFFWPTEFKELVLKTAKNTKLLHMVSLEWLSQNTEKEFNKIAENKHHYKNWLDLHFSVCENPDMLALSSHIMIVIQKKK